jgi:hypothetical protein
MGKIPDFPEFIFYFGKDVSKFINGTVHRLKAQAKTFPASCLISNPNLPDKGVPALFPTVPG